MEEPEVPLAAPDELELTLWWELTADGRLAGSVEVRNVGGRTVRVGGKPTLRPLGGSGEPLDADTVVTLELRLPGHVDLSPGARAAAPVSWAGWAGPPASGRVLVGWDGGEKVVDARGPRQPARTDEPTNLSSSWFSALPPDR